MIAAAAPSLAALREEYLQAQVACAPAGSSDSVADWEILAAILQRVRPDYPPDCAHRLFSLLDC
eukprot:gene29005-44031_t